MRSTYAILGVAALGWLSTAAAPAQDTVVGAGPAESAPVSHVLRSTLFDFGFANLPLKNGVGDYPFGNVTAITCRGGCTVEIDAMVQVGGNKAARNKWDICARVDNKMPLICPTQGTLPTDESYVVGNFAGSHVLLPGTHSLQPTVFVTTTPATVGLFHITYRVYQP